MAKRAGRAKSLTRGQMREIIANYVLEDTAKLEMFTNMEVNGEDSQYDAESALDTILTDMTTEEMTEIVDRINHEDRYGSLVDILFPC